MTDYPEPLDPRDISLDDHRPGPEWGYPPRQDASQPDLPGLGVWRSGFPQEGTPGDYRAIHLTLKMNVPATLVERRSTQGDQTLIDAALRALWEAVEAYAPPPATPIAPQAPTALHEAPRGSQGHVVTGGAPTMYEDTCLGCA